MKKILIFFVALLATIAATSAQNRTIARGATPGELYLTDRWYGIYDPNWGYPYYDTYRTAVYHITENGKKLTIQCDADYFGYQYAPPNSTMLPKYILADATPGGVYNKNEIGTSLWISFDYGKTWLLRDPIISGIVRHYYIANVDGSIHRWGSGEGYFTSTDYGSTFSVFDVVGVGKESGLQYGETFNVEYISNKLLRYSNNFGESYTYHPIEPQFIGGSLDGISPDVYRGGLPGEVYIDSWFYDWTYKVSFSADTGHTFRHVYSEQYNLQNPYMFQPKPFFMSDREPGVFYIIRGHEIEEPYYVKWRYYICIDYYRDYGETLEATFCHDIVQDYEYQEVICDNVTYLDLKTVNQNSIQLQWESSVYQEFIRGYHVYRDNTRITNQLLTEPTYLDKNLQNGSYEYYVRTYIIEGCVSDSSNHVKVEIDVEETCEPVNDLVSEKLDNKTVLLTWSKPKSNLQIKGYHVFRNSVLQNNELLDDMVYLDENLLVGEYEYYVVAHYTNGCVSDSSNHVRESIELGVKGVKELEGVILYPNPTDGQLRITSYKLRIEGIEIFDIYGRKISSHHLIPASSHHQIDISHLQTGFYFINISTENGMFVKKIVKL